MFCAAQYIAFALSGVSIFSLACGASKYWRTSRANGFGLFHEPKSSFASAVIVSFEKSPTTATSPYVAPAKSA